MTRGGIDPKNPEVAANVAATSGQRGQVFSENKAHLSRIVFDLTVNVIMLPSPD